jgi:hypothetical protein
MPSREEKFSLYFRHRRLETINRNLLLSLTNRTHGALISSAAKHQTKCCSRNSKTIHSPRPSSARPAQMATRRPSFLDARSPLPPESQTSSSQEVRANLNVETPGAHDFSLVPDSCAFGSNKYFLLCGLGGIISCGTTHTMASSLVAPLEVFQSNSKLSSNRSCHWIW